MGRPSDTMKRPAQRAVAAGRPVPRRAASHFPVSYTMVPRTQLTTAPAVTESTCRPIGRIFATSQVAMTPTR